jgi:aspartyl protease family protein
MGIQDRDWYRDLQREKAKQEQINATRGKFSAFSRKHFGGKGAPATKDSARQLGLFPMLVFWCLVMGLVYGAMTYYLKPKQAKVLANGDLVMQRSQDGHFYALGKINGVEAKFMVDTGASLVTVSDAFAQKALLLGGTPTTFRTANGDRSGRVVEGHNVSIGPIVATNIKLGVGLSGGSDTDALLGQSFLSKFDITMNKDQLVLRPR